MKGIIALDIDGTTVPSGQTIAPEVIDFLTSLAKEWVVVFITGRSLLGSRLLKALPFPYYLAVQNGSMLFEMPSAKIIKKKYLSKQILPILHQICENEPTDFIIFTGSENSDHCYYRPSCFSEHLLEYALSRAKTYQETWHPVKSFEEMNVEHFPAVKTFGHQAMAVHLAETIERTLGLHVPLCRDPYNENYLVVQATHPEVSKGNALNDLANHLGIKGTLIAAGDDYNDVSMFNKAHVSVVMATAPPQLLSKADLVAPPASQLGIIAGLKAALQHSKLR